MQGPFSNGGYLSTRSWGLWEVHVDDDDDTKRTNDESSRKSRLAKIGRDQLNTNRWFEDLLDRLQHPLALETAYDINPLRSCISWWNQFPEGIDPSYGHLDEDRSVRKRQQVENLACSLRSLIRDGDVVVEFGAGSGHVALVLAALFPQCSFVLLDKKEQSLNIGTLIRFLLLDSLFLYLLLARHRIALSKLDNVRIVCGYIEGKTRRRTGRQMPCINPKTLDFNESFNVGIALHACGEATDMALDKCLANEASYVMAPCCVGKVKHSSLGYPRSDRVQELVSREEYKVLAKAADFGHDTDALALNCINEKRRLSKTFVELDRNLRAIENGYTTRLLKMIPASATPKNDIILGTKHHKSSLDNCII